MSINGVFGEECEFLRCKVEEFPPSTTSNLISGVTRRAAAEPRAWAGVEGYPCHDLVVGIGQGVAIDDRTSISY